MHAIPKSVGSPMQALPALQSQVPASRDGSNLSPNQERSLPPFKELSEMVEAATSGSKAHTNGYPPRRSFSSAGPASGHSPTSATRQFPIATQLSPTNYFQSLRQTSPTSTHGEVSPQDPFVKQLSPRSGSSVASTPLASNRRQSQASESAPPYSGPLTASSNPESYRSSDGYSPDTQPTPNDSHHVDADTPAARDNN